ncbi:hypothetical protein WB91_08655 [bacteria symbiont BFo1 of Frankliniella occidentalis]|uniref:hypothetical protein n=1 Tax=Erwinia aphidicola TaxID=68334 RepID=UPI000789C8AF|nr:hypothetical protein [Erwinia aphidicola]KYP90564.1 hypothetical protein WB91_08655 [bacteria symbiont BFo1 of Frankliniella occidentalis]CAH0299208.1 hypothetical protein SRABI13_04328 [Erwinia aphidicola]
MTTELTFSDGRCAHDGNGKSIRGWLDIYNLASMEGKLMAVCARQKLNGGIDDSDRSQIAFIAFEYVRNKYADRSAMSTVCAELAAHVDQLAQQADRTGWSWAISLEAGARENGGREVSSSQAVMHLKDGGIDYQSLALSGNAIDASVFVPITFTANSNFEIVELSQGKQLAVVAGIKSARQIACYAASLDGGYGDLIIRAAPAKPTSPDFTTWFFS